MQWRPIGICFWLRCSWRGCRVRTSIKVGHYNPDLVVGTYNELGGNPWAEIRATLAAIKRAWPDKRLVVLFQPHRFTRTRLLYKDFIAALATVNNTDLIRLLPIYPAAEQPILGITSELIADGLRKKRKNVRIVEMYDPSFLKELKHNDVLLTVGAGPVWKTGEWVLDQ